MNKIKISKISAEVKRCISDILLTEARDELLKTITVTDCEVTNDLSYAKVYFTSLISTDKAYLEKELNQSASYVRKELSERIDLRHTPDIRFIYDESIAYAQNIDNIIKDIHANDEQ